MITLEKLNECLIIYTKGSRLRQRHWKRKFTATGILLSAASESPKCAYVVVTDIWRAIMIQTKELVSLGFPEKRKRGNSVQSKKKDLEKLCTCSTSKSWTPLYPSFLP